MALINLGLEDTHSDSEFQRGLEIDELREEAIALDTGARIERVMRAKVERGEDLTDEEIYIAAETIGNLYSNMGTGIFNGFGFESYQGKNLTQKEKTSIALEAVQNANKEKTQQLKKQLEIKSKKIEDKITTGKDHFKSISNRANKLLAKIKTLPDSSFKQEEINNKSVKLAFWRGPDVSPEYFKSYKDILSVLEKINQRFDIIASVKETVAWSYKENGKYDISKIMVKYKNEIVQENEEDNMVIFDLNKERLGGSGFLVASPIKVDGGFIKRNFTHVRKAAGLHMYHTPKNDDLDFPTKGLSKKETIDLLENIIKATDNFNKILSTNYEAANTGFMEALGRAALSLFTLNIFIGQLIAVSLVDNLLTISLVVEKIVLNGLIDYAENSAK